jgi:hypothetical protein
MSTHDEWYEAGERLRYTKPHFNRVEVTFDWYVDPALPLSRVGDPREAGSFDQLGAAYSDFMEHEIAAVLPPTVGVIAEPWGGPKTGGPVPDQQYAVVLLDIASQWVGRVVDIAALITIVRAVTRRLEEATGKATHVPNGAAMVLAAHAIMDATGEYDLTLSFVTPLRRYSANLGDFDENFTGWLVGYASATGDLFLAHVSRTGEVTVTADPVNVTGVGE